MTMETALRSRLLADGPVAALVRDRISWGVRPQGSALPAVVLTTVLADRSQHMGGFDGYRRTRMQVDCYAMSKATAVELREAVLAVLVSEGAASGVTFLRPQNISVLERGEQAESGFIFREMIDLEVWHD